MEGGYMPPYAITINWERAEIVFGILLDALQKGKFPYDNAKPPQRKENLPSSIVWGSVVHARFLFCACYYMRGGIKSDTAIVSLGKLFGRGPGLFDPARFASLEQFRIEDSARKMATHLRRKGLNYKAEEIGMHWVLNFQKLHRFWKGDPARLFDNVTSFDDISKVVMHNLRKEKSQDNPCGFYGFREKMVSMLTHFLMDAGVIKPFSFPVPVDFHVLRVMVAHGLLTADVPARTDLYGEGLRSAARELSMRYCETHGVDPLRLGDALWLLSSSLCSLHPGNGTLVGKRNGRKTIISPVRVTWNESQFASFSRSCAECPVNGTCKYNVAAGPYYVQGRLEIRGPRQKPLSLFSFDP